MRGNGELRRLGMKKHRFRFEDVRYLVVQTPEERSQLGREILASRENLEINDDSRVWSVIQVAADLYRDI